MKLSEFAGNLPRKFINFRRLGVESNAHKLPEERESENPQNVAESREVNTVEIGETSASPAKSLCSLEDAPVRAESVGAVLGHEDRNLTMAENDCVLTGSDDDVEDLSAFVAERLQCLSEGSVEKLIREECMNVEEILCGDVGVEKGGGVKSQSVCPDVTTGGDVGVDVRRFSPDVEIDRSLRETLGGANVTSTPKRAIWVTYSKRRSSVMKEPDAPICKAVVFDVGSGSETVGGVGSAKEGISAPSGGVSERLVTSGDFSTLEGIARRQANERFAGVRVGSEGEGMVRIPPVDEMLRQEVAPKERTRYYPSQSAKSNNSLLTDNNQ